MEHSLSKKKNAGSECHLAEVLFQCVAAASMLLYRLSMISPEEVIYVKILICDIPLTVCTRTDLSVLPLSTPSLLKPTLHLPFFPCTFLFLCLFPAFPMPNFFSA